MVNTERTTFSLSPGELENPPPPSPCYSITYLKSRFVEVDCVETQKGERKVETRGSRELVGGHRRDKEGAGKLEKQETPTPFVRTVAIGTTVSRPVVSPTFSPIPIIYPPSYLLCIRLFTTYYPGRTTYPPTVSLSTHPCISNYLPLSKSLLSVSPSTFLTKASRLST